VCVCVSCSGMIPSPENLFHDTLRWIQLYAMKMYHKFTDLGLQIML